MPAGLIGRRRLVALVAAAGVGTRRVASAADIPEQTRFALPPANGMLPARQADGFVDSVGVCTHLDSEPYRSQNRLLRDAIGHSGIRYLRDEFRPGGDQDRWRRRQKDLGIRWHFLASPATNSVAEMMAYLAGADPGTVAAIEGQNEGDSDWFKRQAQAAPNWHEAVVAYQRDLHGAIRERFSVEELPLVSPSVLDYRPQDMGLIRAAAAHSDVVAIHPYVQHAEEPETGDDYASLDWYLRLMVQAFKPGAPCMATEAGYCNAPGSGGVSEAAALRYIPRLLLHSFAAGVKRTFLYEFIDGGTDPADPEQNYGLLRHDGTPKPAFRAVGDLMRVLNDPGPAFAPGVLECRFPDAPPDLRCLLFRRRRGTFVLALWRAAAAWDAGSMRDLPVPARSVAVATGRAPRSAARLLIGVEDAWSPVPCTGNRVDVAVDDRVVLLRLDT